MKKYFYILLTGIFLFMGMAITPFAINAQTFKNLSVKQKGRLDPSLRFIVNKDKTGLKKVMGIMSVNVQAPEPTVDILIRAKAGITRSDLKQISSSLKLRTQAGDIFTASIPINLLPVLALSDKIIFVSATHKMQLENDIAKSSDTNDGKYLGIAAPQGLSGYAGVEGQDVIVGIVDSGIDFRHPDFLTADNKSRILYLWDQTVEDNNPSNFDYGTEWTKENIDTDLSNESCLLDIEECTITERDDENPGHGTHVTGSATGDHPIYTGIAPKADIIFVKTDYSNYIDGVNYIFQKADEEEKPAVINLSLGNSYGPHDGTSNDELAIDNLVGPGKIVVKSAGNSRGANIHSSATITETHVFNLTVQDDITSAWIDLWHDGLDQYDVSVKVNNGDIVTASHGVYISSDSSGITVDIDNVSGGPNPNNNDNEVGIYFTGNLSESGTITVTYTFTGGSGDKRVDGWCDSDLKFDSPDNSMLVTIPGTSTEIITVGAYVSRVNWTSTEPNTYYYPSDSTAGLIASFSSPGPTRDGRIKPDITAPGTVIISSLSQSITPDASDVVHNEEHQIMQGTSMAAPLVTGIIALHLQQNPNLTPDQMKTILANHARTDSETGALLTPDNDWGYGKVLGTPPAWPKPTTLSCTALSTVATDWEYTNTAQNHLGFRVQDAISKDIYDDLPSDWLGFQFTELSTNTYYSLQVSAFNDAGASTSTPAGCYTLAAEPTSFNLSSVQLTSATVQWNDNENPAGTYYQVDYWTLGGSTTSVQTQNTNTPINGLTAFTTYYLRVSAKNGNDIFTNPSSVITALTLPTPPENLSATAQGVSSITWTWDSVADATQYNFYPSTGGSAIALTNPTLTQINISTNTAYSGRVSVLNASGESDLSYSATTYTLAAKPINFNLSSVQLTSATVQWDENENPAGTYYQVDYWTLGGSTTSVQTQNTNTPINGLTAFTTYYLRVSAKNGNDIFTTPSSIITALTLPSSPENLSGTVQGVSSITWTWDSVADATQYNFYPSTGGSAIALTNPSLTQINISTNTAYSGRVSVLNASGESALSDSATTYTLAASPISQAIASVNISSIAINWNINQNPSSTIFTLELSLNNFSSIAASSHTILNTAAFSSLTPNTNYFFRTKATNENNIVTAYTSTLSIVTLANIPSNLSLTKISSASLIAAWERNSNPNDTQFELKLSTDDFSANISTPLPFSGSSNVIEFNLTGLEQETTYYARIYARNSAGQVTDFINAKYFIHTNSIQTVSPSEQVNLIFDNADLTITPNSFPETITVTMEAPTSFPANASFTASLLGINSGIDITLDKDLSPLNNLKLTLTYSMAQATGFNESELLIARYEPNRAVWIPYPSSPNPMANQVTAFIDHLSLFQIMQAAPAGSSVLSSLKVFPNPVYLSRGQTMKFSNLPVSATIKIYTFKGELIRDLTANASGIAEWNGRNSSGQMVASEVYLTLIKSGGKTKVVKVMVER